MLPSEHCFPLTALWIMQTKVLVDTEQDFSIWIKNPLDSNKLIYSLSILEICSYPFMSLKISEAIEVMGNLSFYSCFTSNVAWYLLWSDFFALLSLIFTFYLLILILLQKLERLTMSNLDLFVASSEFNSVLNLLFEHQRITCLRNTNFLFRRSQINNFLNLISLHFLPLLPIFLY